MKGSIIILMETMKPSVSWNYYRISELLFGYNFYCSSQDFLKKKYVYTKMEARKKRLPAIDLMLREIPNRGNNIFSGINHFKEFIFFLSFFLYTKGFLLFLSFFFFNLRYEWWEKIFMWVVRRNKIIPSYL